MCQNSNKKENNIEEKSQKIDFEKEGSGLTQKFIAFIVFSIIGLLILGWYNNSRLESSQNRIVEIYEKQCLLQDSIALAQKTVHNKIMKITENVNNLLSDSIINTLKGIDPKQNSLLCEYMSLCQSNLQNLSEEKFIHNIRSNKDIEDEIHNLLEIQFNRIQNEYEALEIWAGILTIVFLIFSFYSLLKTEQIEQKSNRSMKNITLSEKKIEKILETITNEKKAAITSVQTQYDEWRRTKETELETSKKGLDERYTEWEENSKHTLNNSVSKWEQESNVIRTSFIEKQKEIFISLLDDQKKKHEEDFSKLLKSLKETFEKELSQKKETFNSEINSIYSQVDEELARLKKRVNDSIQEANVEDLESEDEPESDDN